MHFGQEYPRRHVGSFSGYRTPRGMWWRLLPYCCWDKLLRLSWWLQEVAFITFLCSGKREMLWLQECLSPGSAGTRVLLCPNPPSVWDVHAWASVSSLDQAVTVMRSWTSASPLPIKTALVSTGPGLVQKLTLTWLLGRHLPAPLPFFLECSNCKKCPIFFPNFLALGACSFTTSAGVVWSYL